MSLLKDFKPALMFLGKFLALYFVGNILYGVFIESYADQADPITAMVTRQTSAFLNTVGFDTSYENHPAKATVILMDNSIPVIHVFEGCNGVNVMIVFVAFLFAFGGPVKTMSIFLPAGILVIHLFNILRVSLLFHLAQEDSEQFYYFHKYFFTATLYLVVFGLWVLWVMRFNEKRYSNADS